MVPGSGCRAGGPLERAEGRELVTAGPRLAGILLEWTGLGVWGGGDVRVQEKALDFGGVLR